MKVFEYISKRLVENGCKRAFGVPGSYVMPMWQNVNIPITLCVHEGDAAYIASAYAKKTNELTLVLVTSSPGVTNSISGIASSFRDSTPLIVISGCPSVSVRRKGAFQEESDYDRSFFSTEITSRIVKKNYKVERVEDIPSIIKEAIELSLSDRKGPVHISIPVDIQNMDINDDDSFVYEYKLDYKKPKYDFDFEKSLIIIGGGCNSYEVVEKIYEFSSKISAPIICSMKGMSNIYKGDYVLGSVGMGANSEVIDFIKEYNPINLYCFGTSMSIKDFSNIQDIINNSKKYIFSLEDTYGDKFNNYYHFKTNNLGLVIDELLQVSPTIENSIKEQITSLNEKVDSRIKSMIPNSLMSQCIYYVMNNIDSDVIVTSDAGNHYLETITCFKPRNFNTFYIDAGLAAMGNGICSTVGLSAASLNKKCISITGDGCAMMNGNSIYTAKVLNLPIVFIVTNNSSLGRVRVGQSESKRYVSSDINNVDFKKYGEAFNIKSYSADNYDDFVKAFDESLKLNETVVIELISNKDEKPIVFM